MEMDDTETASGWYLQWVKVADPDNQQHCFVYDGWMGGGDGPTHATISPTDLGRCIWPRHPRDDSTGSGSSTSP